MSLFEEGLCRIFNEYGHALVEGEKKYDEFLQCLESKGEPTLILDTGGSIIWASSAFEDLFGFDSAEKQITSLFDIVLPSYRQLMAGYMELAAERVPLDSLESWDKIVTFRGRNGYGEIHSYELFFSGCWRNGSAHLVAVLRDMSDNTNLLEEFKNLEENYSTLSETINEALIRIDENFTIVFANSAVTGVFGYEKEELIGQNFEILFPPEIFERYRENFKKYFLIDEEHRRSIGLEKSVELLGKHKRRGVSPMEMSFGNSSHFKGRTLTCIIRDITKKKNLERQLRKLAYHDRLTNLGNRELFDQEIGERLDRLKDFPSIRGAVMFLDLDGFKQINDTLGHRAGDVLLVETGSRLRGCLRESDSIYRFGGDEFVILLSNIHNEEDLGIVAQKILSSIRSPYYLTPQDESEAIMVNIGVSIGIAVFPDHGDENDTLIKNADLAMYAAKDSGKNRYYHYDESLASKANFEMQIEQGVKSALHNGKLTLHFQPIVDTEGRIEGVEALLRWTDPTLGQISPETFIPIIEEKGLIYPVGSWVIESSCKTLSELDRRGISKIYLSFNVSPLQLADSRFIPQLTRTIERNGVDPSRLQLEITESSLMQHPEKTVACLKEIKRQNEGIRISIDDFGTGYSSLSYLSILPVDSVKIDGSFTYGIGRAENRKIVETIIRLAESLDLSVVAEGVETEEQMNTLKELSCGTLQGFFFCKPLSKDELLPSLQREAV